MASPKHLEILKQGVEVWNEWRDQHKNVIPDFRGADLKFINLANANLSIANLRTAKFSYTNLTRANLSGSNLADANLTGANLTGANLSRCNLSIANLSTANLSKANLEGAILIDADLTRANFRESNLIFASLSGSALIKTDFSNASVGWTIFTYLDLSPLYNCAIGLETIIHKGPSSVGIDTIYQSNGNIPEVFLRGCGLSDEFIAYIPSLTGKGIEYYSCFISYSHKDEVFTKRLHNDLQANGVRCWFAPHDMKIGDKIRPTIDDSIRVHDKLLLILSEHSVQSDWVEHEVEHAFDLEKERKQTGLFPLRIDESIMESTTGWAGNVKRQRHIGDFTKWKQRDAYQSAFDRLLRDLKA